MSKALKNFTNTVTQTEQANARQVENNAGGFVYKVSDKARLERFLILGTDGGTYYASERDITKQNFGFIVDLAGKNPRLLIDTIVDVSVNNRAAKNSPAIFALAVAINSVAPEHKAEVRAAVQQVCRTSTHLFEFAQYVENLGGWGRAKKSAVAQWYQSKDKDNLALQAVKYRQRNGWTHRDLLRLSHPVVDHNSAPVINFMLGKEVEGGPAILEGFRKIQGAKTAAEATALVSEYRLPWETVPTDLLNDADLWKAMVENRTIGHTAILRNLTRMEKIGAFKDLKFARKVADILTDENEVKRGRLHPVAFLNAWGAYDANVPGARYYYRQTPVGNSTPAISAALQDGFYVSFANAEPSNARTLLALDVSGSMTMGEISGLKNLMPLQASAAMATVTLRREPYVETMAFSSGFVPLSLSPRDDMNSVLNKMSGMPFSGTDCAQPMLWAAKTGREFDHFVVYTDSETWQGKVHADTALRDYRQKTGINAKLTVVGMTATNFTIADPQDAGMMDVVGFDANAPKIMADFARV
jgi:60 kDa SS-A/Ro ribonucleoprotein